jgi:hypothetical protein
MLMLCITVQGIRRHSTWSAEKQICMARLYGRRRCDEHCALDVTLY